MYYMVIGCMMLMVKWNRLFFVILSFEFMMMDLFLGLSFMLVENYYFYFICFCVMVSILGLLMLVGLMKFYGSDGSFYWDVESSI